jgi:hypothetical protein
VPNASTAPDARTAELLWLVPLAAAVSQVAVALPGDDVTARPFATGVGLAVTVWLTWLAARRRSRIAWAVLIVFATCAVVTALLAAAFDPSAALLTYLLCSGAALSVLLSRAVREFVLV